MLVLKNVVKEYRSGESVVTALRGISVAFRKNEFVSILGQSGCGKTTLLNIIGGLDRYTTGDLIINGKSTKLFKDKEWDAYRNYSVGFVFQNYNLIPHQSVLSNVELALTLTGVSRADRKRRAVEALEQVGLSEQIHKKPNQLSGGQMQRVAIARALVNNPDILLADEPTGALDSTTSIQVMEILKQVAKDRLVVMVTHNPDLAEKYSTRIIRLLDGRIVSDTNPCSDDEVKQMTKTVPVSKKGKKKHPSMSFFTALSLSLHNMRTKKGRTFMTAFAGSIGIIGIALILSLSNGLQSYISRTEQDTLTGYPVSIEDSSVDMASMMSSMMETVGQEQGNRDTDKVYSNDVLTKMLDMMMADVKKNDLKSFKQYIESHQDQFEPLVSDIKYGYATQLNIYSADMTNGVYQVNPSTVFDTMGINTNVTDDENSALNNIYGSMPMYQGMDVWTELIGNREVLNSQYDVVAGHLPESYNEVVLIVNGDNEISDYTMYTLGLKNSAELKDMMKAYNNGEDYVAEVSDYTYEDLLNLSFKLLLNTDFYEKQSNGIWIDRREDESYMLEKLATSEELRVVGILRPAEGAAIGDETGSIGYTGDLMKHLIARIDSAQIVEEQRANMETDIFTGLAFCTDEEDKVFTMADVEVYIASQPEEKQIEMNAAIMQMRTAGMSDEAIAARFGESISAQISDATYESNLLKLGVADIDVPSKISLYPTDFEAKEKLTKLIDDYNDTVDEDSQISYTDYVGLMMSSITTIIDSVSYVLIAFVAISLVVSSIMIGIITYISVLERTKEIGILRSVGASKRDVSRVFNAETLSVGFAAGLLGILVTLVLTIPINIVIQSITSIAGVAVLPWQGAVILVAISMLLTFIAGLIPSRVAANKDPVVALRTE